MMPTMMTLPIDVPTIRPRLKQSFSLHTSLVLPGSSGHAPPESASLIVVTFLDLVPSPHDTLQVDQGLHSLMQGHAFLQTLMELPNSSGHAPPGSASLMIVLFLDLVPSPHDTLQGDQSLHS